MLCILFGLMLCLAIGILTYKYKVFNVDICILLTFLMLLSIFFGVFIPFGYEEFKKVEEIPICKYEDSNKYVKEGLNYYKFLINKSKEYDVNYDSYEEYQVLKDRSRVYEQESIEIPVIVKYIAKSKRNFVTFGLLPDKEQFRIYIPKGTLYVERE